MRVLLQPPFRLIDTYEFKHLGCPYLCLLLCFLRMQADRLHDLTADSKYRIQARHRILENDTAAFSAEASHLFAVKLCQILSTIQHLPADDPTGIRQNLHD